MGHVEVHPGWPGDKYNARITVWADDLDGEVSTPLMTGGRVPRDDEWTTTWGIRVATGRTLDDAMQAMVGTLAALEDVLANDPTIGGSPGVLWATVTAERHASAVTPDGPVAFAEIEVTTRARLS